MSAKMYSKVLMAGLFSMGALLVGLGERTIKADKGVFDHFCTKSTCKLQKSVDDATNCSKSVRKQ